MADIWISDRAGDIGEFNTATGRLVPGTGHNTGLELTDIAFIGSQMYATSFDTFYAVNDKNGASASGGNYSFTHEMNALVGNGAGILAASRTSDDIYSITTKGVSVYANTGYHSAGDLAFAGGKLYESVVERNGLDGLFDVTDHRLIGTFGHGGGRGSRDLFGLVSDGSTMYAVAGHDIFRVNLATAELAFLSSDAGSGIGLASGAAFVGENTHG